MDKSLSDPCFKRLIQSLIANQQGHCSTTIFIGAGCSLASSEKDITTYGIVRELVKQFSFDEQPPDDWRTLYENFVNIVWNGQGTKNRINLLQGFFRDMHPSEGYYVLRWLVENKYIDNIITTNFDPMINTILEGLSYHLIVGEHIEEIGDNPQFTLIKAHGDLQIGQLRFAPAELAKLPDTLTEKIQAITKCVMLVIGYRGQDTGILNALYDTDEYNAYWISKDKPDQLNAHDFQQVQIWMHNRNSDNNYLSGSELGTFDNLFKNIKATLIKINQKKKKTNAIRELWKNSSIANYLNLNKRFEKLFELFNDYLEQQLSGRLWKPASPYFASSYERLVKLALELINESLLPASYYSISNEVDALIFATSCSVWLACEGYPCTVDELLSGIRLRFEQENTEILICEKFWEMLSQLSHIDLTFLVKADQHSLYTPNASLSFCFDMQREFSTVLKFINVQSIQKLLAIIGILLLFKQTSGNDGDTYYKHQNKKALEKYLYEIQNMNGTIILQMSSIPEDTYKDLFESLLKLYVSEYKLENRRILLCSPISIEFPIEPAKQSQHINIWESLVQEAEIHFRNFLNEFESNRYIDRKCFQVFSDFLSSQSSGLFVIGESGCGKTSALKVWLSGLPLEEYLIYAVNGRDQDSRQNLGEKAFGEFFIDQNKLGYLQTMLQQRQQTLLLVFDAINEVQGNFSQTMVNYQALLTFCDYLANKALKNIKLIITCRSDLFYQFKKDCSIIPSSSSFYSSFVVDDVVSTVYTIPYYNIADVETFAKLELYAKRRIDINELLMEFGDLIYLPINLQMICDAYQETKNPLYTLGNDQIFDTWYQGLQGLGKKEGIAESSISSIIEYAIDYSYFSSNDDALKTHSMASALASKCTDTLAVYEWLTNHGIFRKNPFVPNRVQFSHDRLEEYFLTNYILKCYGNHLEDLDQFLSAECSNLSVLNKALLNALIRTSLSDKLQFMNALIQIVRKKSDWLQPIVIDAIFQIIDEDANHGYAILKEMEQYLFQNDFYEFVEAVLNTYKQDLEIKDSGSLGVIKVISHIVETMNTLYDFDLRTLSLYLLAKSQFLLPSENDTDRYKEALSICKQAEDSITSDTPDDLVNQISILKAMLLQNQGLLNEAIALMEVCYRRQKDAGQCDFACQSALYLGAMYREMTRFDEAIDLYNSINIQYIEDETKINRLCMNKGIIYKNKVQNAMFAHSLDRDYQVNLYSKALEFFEKTCAFAEKKDNIPLRLEIYAELVECTCLAYYLNCGTISDAVHWAVKMDEIIGRYSVPVERIQLKRMWARVLTLQGKFTEAISYLEEGYSIAVDYNILFRATDCCNLITGIISDNLNKSLFITEDILKKGLTYGEYAINYYKALKNNQHRYLQDSIIKYDKIKEAWQKTQKSS